MPWSASGLTRLTFPKSFFTNHLKNKSNISTSLSEIHQSIAGTHFVRVVSKSIQVFSLREKLLKVRSIFSRPHAHVLNLGELQTGQSLVGSWWPHNGKINWRLPHVVSQIIGTLVTLTNPVISMQFMYGE
jgi:hypothetical protein